MRADAVHGKKEFAMLVLSRKMDEQIVIGDEIRITVLRVKGDRVKLGIQAGNNVKIMRGELLDTTGNGYREATVEAAQRIVDPTMGLADEDQADDNTPAGARDGFLGPTRPEARPAWLTICCCS